MRFLTPVITLIICLGSTANAENIDHLIVPEGFTLSIYANNLDDARQMALGENGTVFVGSRGKGSVRALQDTDGDGRADRNILIARRLNMPSGIAYKDGSLYVAEVDKILRYRNIEQQLLSPPKPEVVFSNLPNKRHHGWKYIDFSPTGELYVPVGAPCNVCNEDDDRFATILKVDLKSDHYQIIAKGVRNSVGFDWHPQSGELWFSENGRDMMGDDIPPCEINRVTVPGSHFGFPYIHAGSIQDPEFFDEHSFSDYHSPALSLDAHVAPLGIQFYRGKQFPERYHNQLLVAEHGSWNRSKKSGYRVMVATLENNQVVSYKPLVSGFLNGEETLGRPVAFLEMPDGSVLISDDFAKKIYRLTYSNQ